nr:hypothetical protein [Tanacetum cinerariifolium]
FGFPSNNDKISNESLLDLKKVKGYMVRFCVEFYGGEEDERELLEMRESREDLLEEDMRIFEDLEEKI